MSQRLFIAVSTSQNISNLSPIFQFAEEDDLVLWLQTPEAAQANWTAPTLDVLHERGLRTYVQQVTNLYTPAQIYPAIANYVTHLLQAEESIDTIYFVLNGGLKITAIALNITGELIQQEHQEIRLFFLYGQARPSRLLIFPYLNETSTPQIDTYTPDRMPSHQEIIRVNGMRSSVPRHIWHPGQYWEVVEQLTSRNFFNSVIRQVKQSIHAFQAPPERLFDKAVYARVVRFFQEHPEYYPIIKEVLWDYAAIKNGEIYVHFDVSIILTNGIAIHIKCEHNSEFISSDYIHAYTQRIEKATGDYAQLYIATIVYPHEEREETYHQWAGLHRRFGIPILNYWISEHEEPPPPNRIPSFEYALHTALQKYLREPRPNNSPENNT